MFTPSMTPNQIRSMPSFSAGRPEQRNDDEGDLEEIEEEGEHEDENVDEDQEADLAARQDDQQFLDPAVAVDAIERQREHARADQDEDHESGELGGRFGRLPRQVEGQPALHHRQQHRAGRAHGAAFGRRRDADEDRAEHEEDQRQRRHHHEDDLLGQRQERKPDAARSRPR